MYINIKRSIKEVMNEDRNWSLSLNMNTRCIQRYRMYWPLTR